MFMTTRAQLSLCAFIFLLTFGHHVKFKAAQGRRVIIPTAVTKRVETLINMLLIYL